MALVGIVTTDQVLARGAGGQLARAHTAPGVDRLADGNDRVPVVASEPTSDAVHAFGPKCLEILSGCLGVKLPSGKYIVPVQRDALGGGKDFQMLR